MRSFVFFILTFSFLFVSGGELPISATTEVTGAQSTAIIKKVVDKYSVMYQKYAGVEYDRHLTVDWLYVKTLEVAKKEKVIYHRKNYFYDHIGFQTLLYEVDGKPEALDDYDAHEDLPGIPPFDKNGGKEYKRTVKAVEMSRNKLCYRIYVTPRDPGTRHFKGNIWVTVDGLEMIKWEGTAGKMRFGAQKLFVKFYCRDFGDYFSFTSGYTKATLNVLGLYKRVLVFNFVNKNIKPMLKKK